MNDKVLTLPTGQEQAVICLVLDGRLPAPLD